MKESAKLVIKKKKGALGKNTGPNVIPFLMETNAQKKLSRKNAEREKLPPLPGKSFKEYKTICEEKGIPALSESRYYARKAMERSQK